MKIKVLNKGEAIVELDSHELGILSNALNEVCHGLDLIEFSTRMGASLEEVQKLLYEIGKVIISMKDDN